MVIAEVGGIKRPRMDGARVRQCDCSLAVRVSTPEGWGDGGQQVLVATDRPVGFWEATSGRRSLDYPFTIIQVRVDGQNKDEGKMSIATKVIAAGNTIVLENCDTQPVLLSDVRLEE